VLLSVSKTGGGAIKYQFYFKMKLSDFNFNLPSELIAQTPREKRDESDLLLPVHENDFQKIKFFQLIDHLLPSDLIVFNDSKVINAQLTLVKGVKKININLNRPIEENIWTGFARPAKKLEIGDCFRFADHQIFIEKKLNDGEIHIKFVLNKISIFEFLELYGEVPLPVYIKRQVSYESDKTRYQTVYSKVEGSVAAPTAGLHFTNELLESIKKKGVTTCHVTLHVGAGTFLPVKTENISEHKMHFEYCQINQETANLINQAKNENRRIIVVGTTALRTIESLAKNGKVIAAGMETNIFITPGYRFQIADLLLTNFHLPKSTLFMLVCAFAGMNRMKNAYKYAIDNKMRFFSYGDAMLLKHSNGEYEDKIT
jgi:S-adenosylmethionine:tRNA ribosyltransferase-isomerase